MTVKTTKLIGTLISEQKIPQWITEIFPDKTSLGIYEDKDSYQTYVDLQITIPYMRNEIDKSKPKTIFRYCIPIYKTDNIIHYDYNTISTYEVSIAYNGLDDFIYHDNTIFDFVTATPIVQTKTFNYIRNNAGISGETNDSPAIYFINGEDSPVIGISKTNIVIQTNNGGVNINDNEVKITANEFTANKINKQTAYMLPGKEDRLNQSMNISGDGVAPWVGLTPDFVKIITDTNNIMQMIYIIGGLVNFVGVLYNTTKEIKNTTKKTLNITSSNTEEIESIDISSTSSMSAVQQNITAKNTTVKANSKLILNKYINSLNQEQKK